MSSHEPGILLGRFCEDNPISLLGSPPQLVVGVGARVPLLSQQVCSASCAEFKPSFLTRRVWGEHDSLCHTLHFACLSSLLLPPVLSSLRALRQVLRSLFSLGHVERLPFAWPGLCTSGLQASRSPCAAVTLAGTEALKGASSPGRKGNPSHRELRGP